MSLDSLAQYDIIVCQGKKNVLGIGGGGGWDVQSAQNVLVIACWRKNIADIDP